MSFITGLHGGNLLDRWLLWRPHLYSTKELPYLKELKRALTSEAVNNRTTIIDMSEDCAIANYQQCPDSPSSLTAESNESLESINLDTNGMFDHDIPNWIDEYESESDFGNSSDEDRKSMSMDLFYP